MDGAFTSWSEWGICTTIYENICGKGKRDRHRFCTNPVPRNLGMPCVGEYHDTEKCEIPCEQYGKDNLLLPSAEVV